MIWQLFGIFLAIIWQLLAKRGLLFARQGANSNANYVFSEKSAGRAIREPIGRKGNQAGTERNREMDR